MRRLLLSLLAMAALLWVLDRAIGGYLERLYVGSPSDDGDVLARGFAHRPAVVVCGDSRAQNHYVSDSLETWLGRPFYNFGRGGMPTLYMYGVAEMALRHARPRVWILEGETNLYAYPDNHARLNFFLPYAAKDPTAAALVNTRSPFEPLKRWSRIYPYNSLVLSLLGSRVGRGPTNRLGYVPLHGPPLRPEAVQPADPDTAPRPDPEKDRYIRRMVRDLREAGVAVVGVRSPRFLPTARDLERDAASGRSLRAYYARLGVPFLDLGARTIPAFRDRALFVDGAHLGEVGALVFSRALADSLKARGLP